MLLLLLLLSVDLIEHTLLPFTRFNMEGATLEPVSLMGAEHRSCLVDKVSKMHVLF